MSGALVTRGNHECNKRYCEIRNQKWEVGQLSYLRHLKDVLPTNAEKLLYVFHEFETTQNSDTANAHVPNLVSVMQLCEV